MIDQKGCVLAFRGSRSSGRDKRGNRQKEVSSQVLCWGRFGSTEEDTLLVGVKEGFLEEVMWHLKLRSKDH